MRSCRDSSGNQIAFEQSPRPSQPIRGLHIRSD